MKNLINLTKYCFDVYSYIYQYNMFYANKEYNIIKYA